ncbi:MAG: tetratricopeptide repeat protein [Vicinamibacterales bacterium]
MQPDNAFAYASRGGNLRAQAKLSASDSERRHLHERALADYDRAITLGGFGQREAVAYEERGFVNQSLSHLDAAIADFTRVIELRPDYGLAYSDRADSLRVKAGLATSEPERASQYERSVADYDKAVQLGGLGQREALAHANRGFALYYLGRLDAAIADFTEAIEIVPGAPFFFSSRAIAYADNKQCSSAIADAEKASSLTDDPALALQVQGVRDYIARKCK